MHLYLQYNENNVHELTELLYNHECFLTPENYPLYGINILVPQSNKQNLKWCIQPRYSL